MDLRKWIEEQGGVAGVRDLADFLEVSEARVRDWAYENELPRVGNSVVFTFETAEELEAELASEESDDEDDDIDDDEPQDEEPRAE
jgi:hypothetical protein